MANTATGITKISKIINAGMKNFKQVVTKEHLSNPALKKITDTIAAESTKKGNAEAYLKKLEKLFNDLKKTLSKTWNENIDGKRMPSIEEGLIEDIFCSFKKQRISFGNSFRQNHKAEFSIPQRKRSFRRDEEPLEPVKI